MPRLLAMAGKDWNAMPPDIRLTLDSPGAYKIRVQGHLDESWSAYVSGVGIRIQSESREPPVTVITGEFNDQAALAGALSHLYDLGFPLLSVEFIGIEQQK
jgi:hypothetical protein